MESNYHSDQARAVRGTCNLPFLQPQQCIAIPPALLSSGRQVSGSFRYETMEKGKVSRDKAF